MVKKGPKRLNCILTLTFIMSMKVLMELEQPRGLHPQVAVVEVKERKHVKVKIKGLNSVSGGKARARKRERERERVRSGNGRNKWSMYERCESKQQESKKT